MKPAARHGCNLQTAEIEIHQSPLIKQSRRSLIHLLIGPRDNTTESTANVQIEEQRKFWVMKLLYELKLS